MTDVLQVRVRQIVPEFVKNKLAALAKPRVVEQERQLAEQVDHALGVFVADIEREVRAAEARMPALLDSRDVRLAISDLRNRGALLSAALNRKVIGVEALLEFIASVTDLGTGGIKAAETAEEVADAAGRAIDHVEGYMLSRGHVPENATIDVPPIVRRLTTAVTFSDVEAWRPDAEARFTEIGRGASRAVVA